MALAVPLVEAPEGHEIIRVWARAMRAGAVRAAAPMSLGSRAKDVIRLPYHELRTSEVVKFRQFLDNGNKSNKLAKPPQGS